MNRPPRLQGFVGLLVRLSLSVIACLALASSIWWDNAANRGIPARAPTEPIPWADVPRGGVNTYLLHAEVVTPAQRRSGENKVAHTFQMIREGGFQWVRVQFPWEDIEVCGKNEFVDCRGGSEGQSTWTKYDYIVEQARANNLDLIVRLDRPPDWARQQAIASPEVQAATAQGIPVTGPPDEFEDYADYVGAIARRYADDLRFYQIWNEPNLPGEWNYHRLDPAEFVRLLRMAGAAIQANDPDAVIIFPALSPTDGADGVAANDLEYLQGVYDAGGRDDFDIMSAQFYGLGQPPDEHRYITPGDHLLRPIETRADVSRVVLQHEIMVRNGDDNKAVWISELGWNSAPQELPHQWGMSVTEQDKAHYLVGAMERAQREWPWMGAMCIWMFRWGGEPPNPADPTPYFQLVDFDFKPLPAYEQVAAYLGTTPTTALASQSIWPKIATFVMIGVVVAMSAWTWPLLLSWAARALLLTTGWLARAGRRTAQGWTHATSRLPRPHLSDRSVALLMLLGLAIFYRGSPQLPITVLGALIFGPLALYRPRLALLFVLLTVPLYLAPKGVWDARFGLSRPDGYFLPLHEFALFATIAGTMLHAGRDLLRRRDRGAQARTGSGWLRSHTLPLLVLLVGIGGVLVASDAGRRAALREWRWLIVEPLIFYGLVLYYGRDRNWRRGLVWTWLGAGVVIAIIGILQSIGLNLAPIVARQTCFSADIVSTEGVQRATSIYCHPNNLGLALGRVWPVLAALALGGTTAILGMRTLRLAPLPTALTGIVLAGIGASFSRGAILGCMAALAALGLTLRRRLLIALAVAGVVLGIVVALVVGIERFNPLGGSSSARLELWGSAAAMLRDHPLTGVGLDQFLQLRMATPEGGRYITPAAAASSELYASHPHNMVLDTLLRVGPLGLIVFVLLIVYFFRLSRRLRVTTSGDERAIIAGLIASMVAALVHGMVDNFYFVPDLAMVFWLQMGIVELATNDQRRTTNADGRTVMEQG